MQMQRKSVTEFCISYDGASVGNESLFLYAILCDLKVCCKNDFWTVDRRESDVGDASVTVIAPAHLKEPGAAT